MLRCRLFTDVRASGAREDGAGCGSAVASFAHVVQVEASIDPHCAGCTQSINLNSSELVVEGAPQ